MKLEETQEKHYMKSGKILKSKRTSKRDSRKNNIFKIGKGDPEMKLIIREQNKY